MRPARRAVAIIHMIKKGLGNNVKAEVDVFYTNNNYWLVLGKHQVMICIRTPYP